MTHEIVAPEPHANGNCGRAWEYIPRWPRIVLCAIVIGTVILVAYLTR
jgi:hypothetical protein